ncbi:MAG: sensor histidine kinase [Ktedonobacterales bacterium]
MRTTPPHTSDDGDGGSSDTRLSPLASGAHRIREALQQTTRPLRRSDQPGAAMSGASSAMFSTIRNRLIFWYVGVLAAILLLVGIVLYVAMQQTLFAEVNSNLATSAQIVSRAWQLNQEGNDPTPICLDNPTLRNISNQLAPLDTPYISCFDNRSNPYVLPINCPFQGPSPSFQNACQIVYIDPTLAQAALTSSTNSATDRVTASGLGTLQRYAQVVYAPDGSIIGVVQVATSIDGQLAALATLGRLLLLCGLLTILGATAGGIFLAQRALQPAHLAFQRQQEFIADAAHELRTPLTLLRANAEVLLRGRERLDPDDTELLEDIVAESAHMAGLANNLLTLARLDSGQGSVKRDVVDMAEIAAGLVRQARSFAAEQQVVLSLAQLAGPALVVGDETLLNEAALILIDNAIKYNKPGGSVTITVETGQHEVKLYVQDTGVGIQAEHLAHLGERFYRPDKARSREMGGAGLGLSIARSIATTHSGSLSLTSTPEQGTTAVLTLPAAQLIE